MPQLHMYVGDDVARRIRERAKTRGIPVSRYLAELVTRDVVDEWPAEFFEEVVGGWHGEPLERPRQGEYEQRTPFAEPED